MAELETILTVWVEMIQRQKIVAIPADVGKDRYEPQEGGYYRLVRGPERDPATSAKRSHHEMEPWTIVPWTPRHRGDLGSLGSGLANDRAEDGLGGGRASARAR
jgi:hypothetical protein